MWFLTGDLLTSPLEPRHWNWNWNWNWYCKRFYLQFLKAYGPQTLQDGDLVWGDPVHKATWHFDIVVTWQIKNIISLLSQGLWTPNLVEWWRKMRERHPQSHVIHRSRVYVTNEKQFISTFTRPMAPKHGRLPTQDEESYPKGHVTL